MTKKGYMGLALEQARKGDQVAILLGRDVPFVLRTREGSGFVMVGETYVHGIMNGEAMSDVEKGVNILKIIELHLPLGGMFLANKNLRRRCMSFNDRPVCLAEARCPQSISVNFTGVKLSRGANYSDMLLLKGR